MRDTANRLLRLLSLLQARSFWRGAEIADHLDVTERTVRRDVERLRELGYPVEASPGVGGGYRLGRGKALPPLLLDDEEAVAVAVSLRTAAGETVSGIGGSAMRALAKLEQVLPTRLRAQVSAVQTGMESIPAGTPTVEAATLLSLAQACRDRVEVHFTYQGREGETSERRVEPHRLVSTGRRWYLVARDRDRDDWRSFRVDRLSRVVARGRRFVPADPPDAAAFVARGVSTAVYRHQARVLLHVSLAQAADRVPPTTGVLVPVDGDRCELTIGADSLTGMAAHLAMLGCDFEVLEPPGLTDAVQAMAARLTRATVPAAS